MGGLINLNKKYWQWIILILLAFIWGASFILMKKGLQSYTNMQVAALRIFISFIILLPFSIRRIKILSLKNLKSLLIVGYIGTAIPAMLFTKAQTHVDSALAGMLNSLTPLFTFIISLLFYKSYARYYNIIGIFMGLLGAMGLMLKGSRFTFADVDLYTLFIVAATLCYGINVNEIKHNLKALSAIEITSLSFLLAGPPAGVYLLFSDYSQALSTNDYVLNLIYITILALFSTVLAPIIFNVLIKYTTAIFAASVTYIIPIFAIFWGVFDGEIIHITHFIWIIVILFGVYLVNKNNYANTKKT